MAYYSKNCLRSRKFGTSADGAKMSWVWNALGPKCLDTDEISERDFFIYDNIVDVLQNTIKKRGVPKCGVGHCIPKTMNH